MGEEDPVIRCENEAPAELERIFPQCFLSVSRGLRPRASRSIVLAQEVEERSGLQLDSRVRFAFGVDEERKRNLGLSPKRLGISLIAETDRCDLGSGLFDFTLSFAQLRDVLAAEDSTVVPQERENRGLPFPQGSQANELTLGVL